jgi:hypothetical protein
MRFMILVKATADSEAGVMPSEALIAEMAAYHEELARAGALVDASGLKLEDFGGSRAIERFRDMGLGRGR